MAHDVNDIPAEIQHALGHALSGYGVGLIKDFRPVYGGCINNAGQLITHDGPFFLKWNERIMFPGMLYAEAAGLELLRANTDSFIPSVIHVGETSAFQFLVLEWITPAGRSSRFSSILAEKLAGMHKASSLVYGLNFPNYIGSLQQINEVSKSWVGFYSTRRLRTQFERARQNGLMTGNHERLFESLVAKLPGLLPEECPSLLHGDLWNGNVISSADGTPRLIDPAVYYGSREVDLSMMLLFGGFDGEFFKSYESSYPLTPGWRDRVDLYQLYPLLVHVNLFGTSYVPGVVRTLKRYV